MASQRALSGVQPTGFLHLGNYLGAIKQFVELQDSHDIYCMVVDLHGLTVPQNPAEYQRQVRHIAAVYLACGLDPKKAVMYRQSAIPAHSELAWLLMTITSMGELNRMTQFKEKTGRTKADSIGAGLFTYPVLMAADILLYQPQEVPVGEDQKQHVELTRDLAERFNRRFGDTFVVPQPVMREVGARIMGLDDPSKKMSKSAASAANYIALTDSPATIRKKISKAVTDSGSVIKSGPSKPALTNLLTIYSLLQETPVEKLEKQYAGSGYGEFKQELADVIVTALEPIQEKLKELEADPGHVDSVLHAGAERARPVAEKTLQAAQAAIGLR